MPDPRFYITAAPIPVRDALALAGLDADAAGEAIERAAPADADDLGRAVLFVDNKRAAAGLAGKSVGLCFAAQNLDAPALSGAWIPCAAPRRAFAKVASRLHKSRPYGADGGVQQGATLARGVTVAPGALICTGAEIGARSSIGPCAVIGPGVVLGEGAEIGAGATITHTIAGKRLRVLAGAHIGEHGFGFAPGPDGLTPIPQLGRVILGDDVDIGANTTIDRGALRDTEIGDRVKIDNLVQIGHNVRIGADTVIVSQVGISGSVVIGRGVLVGGQAGIADHFVIGDGAQLGARAGVMSNVPAGEKWAGYPARPLKSFLREAATLKRLAGERKKKGDG